jgi:hypothetical protein
MEEANQTSTTPQMQEEEEKKDAEDMKEVE